MMHNKISFIIIIKFKIKNYFNQIFYKVYNKFLKVTYNYNNNNNININKIFNNNLKKSHYKVQNYHHKNKYCLRILIKVYFFFSH